MTLPGRPLARARRAALTAALLLVAGELLARVPASVGSGWHEVAATVADVPLTGLAVLSVVWLAGLVTHTMVLTASLPGLSGRRALALNLAGSSVANSLPLGGALSLGLTTSMSRSWGFRGTEFATCVTVSNLWNLLAKITVGALAGAVLTVVAPGAVPLSATAVAVGIALAAVLAPTAGLATEGGSRWLGRRAGGWVDRVSVALGRGPRGAAVRLAARAVELRRAVAAVLRSGWHRLTLGMVGYTVLQLLLLDLCLRLVGSPRPLLVVLAVLGVERLLTAVPVTPGGSGVAELGMAAALAATGTAGTAAASAVLLFRLFTFALEIPVGAVVGLCWWWRRA